MLIGNYGRINEVSSGHAEFYRTEFEERIRDVPTGCSGLVPVPILIQSEESSYT